MKLFVHLYYSKKNVHPYSEHSLSIIYACNIIKPYFYNLLCTIYLELHDAVFVVGALDETIILRGMRYHPIDIENSVMRCHRKIAEW